MKKQFFCVIFSICMLLAIAPNIKAATVDYGECGENVSYTMSSNGTLTISGTGDMYNDFNDILEGYLSEIKKVVVNKGVTGVGMRAFANCTSLTDVSLPDGLKTLGSGAFINCISLQNINIPDSVTTIQQGGTFWGCSSLTNIHLPNGLAGIGDSTFRDCVNLTDINIPNHVTAVGTYAFWRCTSLTSIEFPDSVESIGYGAFRDCTNLSEVKIGNNVTTIGQYAFTNCNDVVLYGDESSYAYEYAVSNNIPFNGIVGKGECGADGDNLKWSLDVDGTLTISGTGDMANYKRLYGYKFENEPTISITNAPWSSINSYYRNIKQIIIEDGVISVGDYAFVDLKKLTRVSLPNSITYIGMWSFGNCLLLYDISMPESIETIGSRAFSGCSSLREVSLGSKLSSVKGYSFAECSSLEYIDVDVSNEHYCSVDGILFTKDMTSLISYPPQIKKTTYSIPEGVIELDNYSFAENRHLTVVTMPTTLKRIYSDAFFGCSAIKNVTIPGNVEDIDEWVFQNCTALEYVIIEEGVQNISTMYGLDTLFSKCTSLKYIVLPKSLTRIGYSYITFEDCPSLLDIYYGGSKEEFAELLSTHIPWRVQVPFDGITVHFNSVGINPPRIVNTPTCDGEMLNVELENTEYDSSLITVFSNDNTMISFEETTVSAGDKSKSVTVPAEGATRAKVFIWDSLSGMRPLCDAQEIEIVR